MHFRYLNNEGKLRAKEITHIDPILSCLSDFVLCSNKISCLSFALSAGFFGGAQGTYRQGMTRWCFGMFIVNTNVCRNFDSIMYEDRIYAIKNFDLINLCYYGLDFETPKMGSNSGGISYDDIINRGEYLKIMAGDKVDLLIDGRVVYHPNLIFPKIINETYKK